MGFTVFLDHQILLAAAALRRPQATGDPVEAQFKLLLSVARPAIPRCINGVMLVQFGLMALWNKAQHIVFVKRNALLHNIF